MISEPQSRPFGPVQIGLLSLSGRLCDLAEQCPGGAPHGAGLALAPPTLSVTGMLRL